MEDQKGRTAMSIWVVCTNVGGIQQVLIALSICFFAYYSELAFILEATDQMFKIKNIGHSQNQTKKALYVGFLDKVKLSAGCCAKPRLKKLVEVGREKLEVQFDLMYMMKRVHHHHKYVEDVHDASITDETIDIEKEMNEMEESSNDQEKSQVVNNSNQIANFEDNNEN